MFYCKSNLTVSRRKTFWEQTKINAIVKQQGIMGVVVSNNWPMKTTELKIWTAATDNVLNINC